MRSHKVTTKPSQVLTHVFIRRPNGTQNQRSLSLTVENSDYWHNQSVLGSLIGTLVKYGPSGRIEPYLADRFHVSEDSRSWTFHMREGLRCENGDPITAASFKQQLLSQLKKYAQKGSVITFDSLIGWDDFVGERSVELPGVATNSSEEIIFSFSHKPEDMLELLRMVYFGYWCHSNGTLISSSAYALDPSIQTSPEAVRVKIRPDWFSVDEESFEELYFAMAEMKDALSFSRHSIVHLGLQEVPRGFEKQFKVISGTPTILRAIILSPFKEGPFKNVKNRMLFAERVRQSKLNLAIQGTSVAKSFYLSSEPKSFPKSGLSSYVGIHPGTKISVVGPTDPQDTEGRYIRNLIEEAVAGSGIEIDYVSTPDAFSEEDVVSNKAIDIRIDGVDIGVDFLNFATKMMFCTTMGIAFPDPSKRMCNLVREYESADKLPDREYADRFNQILASDGCVIPIAHRAMNWLVTKDIDLESLPPAVIHPQFEKVLAKEV